MLALSTVLAGALLAGVLLPWVGGPALLAASRRACSATPPHELTDEPPPGNTTMLAANGELITSFYEQNRAPVTSEQIAQVMKHAMVAIEDSRFYEHNGLDVEGTLRALVKNIAAGEVQEGGSTLTQQLVKQTLLQSARTPEERDAAIEESVGRKLREARLALALEDTYSKDEILTRYLNIVYFGQNAYGIQAAAHAFFGIDAAALTCPRPPCSPGWCRARRTTTRSSPRGRAGPAQPGADPHGRAGLHHARGAGRGDRRPARAGPGAGPAPRLRGGQRRPATSATSCSAT